MYYIILSVLALVLVAIVAYKTKTDAESSEETVIIDTIEIPALATANNVDVINPVLPGTTATPLPMQQTTIIIDDPATESKTQLPQ
jgi:hypothetical protein